jgi:hypothetical protein
VWCPGQHKRTQLALFSMDVVKGDYRNSTRTWERLQQVVGLPPVTFAVFFIVFSHFCKTWASKTPTFQRGLEEYLRIFCTLEWHVCMYVIFSAMFLFLWVISLAQIHLYSDSYKSGLYVLNYRLSINRPTKRGKEKSLSDGHCQCEKEMDNHFLACQ